MPCSLANQHLDLLIGNATPCPGDNRGNQMVAVQHGQMPSAAVNGRTRRLLPWMILSIGMILSIVAFFLVRDWEEAIIRADFEVLASTHAASLHRELSRHIDASAALVGLFDASQDVERHEFHQFAKGLLKQHSDIQAIMWTPVVAAAAAPELQRQAAVGGADLGLNAFISYRDADGAARPIYMHVFRSRTNDAATTALPLSDQPLVWRGPLDKADPNWQIVFTPAPQFWGTHPIWRSWAVSAVGLLLSLYIGSYLLVLARQTSRAESLADHLVRSNAKLENEISERTRIEKQAVKLSRAIEQGADTVMITDRNGLIEYINPAFETMTGFGRDEAIGQKSNLVKSDRHVQAFYSRLWGIITRGEGFQDVLVNRKKNGALYYEEMTITPLKDADGNTTHFIATGKDITDRMQTQER